jgi:hypothetical protein
MCRTFTLMQLPTIIVISKLKIMFIKYIAVYERFERR